MSNPRQHQQLHDIVAPHEHDVLSGRGNFVNYHAGNEHFRALVRKHKVAYVACPKPQKGKFSRMIVDEIRARNPPGRFLKQDASTKLWQDIGEKKALDKTRQALREGAPEISKELTGEDEVGGGLMPGAVGMQNSVQVPGGGGIYGLNDGMGGYGTPDLKNDLDDPQQIALSNMMQQQQRMQQQQHQPQQQMMGPSMGQPSHPGQMYAMEQQRMQQQQLLQQRQQQQMLRQQQQTLSKQLGGGGQLGGGMGGMGGMGPGMGGVGVNPYAKYNNDYDELEPTPLDSGSSNAVPRYNNSNPYAQMSSNQSPSLQAQLQAQAQLQVQQQQMQQMQQQQQRQQMQQQAQLRQQNQGRSLNAHLEGGGPKNDNKNNNHFKTSTAPLKDGGEKKRPSYQRDSSEQSLQLGHAFEDTIEHGVLDGTGSTDKNKQKMGGSSNHLSLMSLTVSELDGDEGPGVAGDLSAMFDSSLQISDKRVSGASIGSSLNTSNALDSRRQSTENKAALLDMSVATIGNDMSNLGGFGGPALGGDVEDSQAEMSFSHMFDDSDRNNL